MKNDTRAAFIADRKKIAQTMGLTGGSNAAAAAEYETNWAKLMEIAQTVQKSPIPQLSNLYWVLDSLKTDSRKCHIVPLALLTGAAGTLIEAWRKDTPRHDDLEKFSKAIGEIFSKYASHPIGIGDTLFLSDYGKYYDFLFSKE